jgi:NAD(P)-dependent dehydrogenase (short-subunit alcohol dehydrogenase family)
MDLGLTGTTAVVTGAARGIGRAIATAFAEEGAAVALLDRDDVVADVARQLEEMRPNSTLGLAVDVTDYAAVRQAVAAIRERFGRLDHVVHAAAIGSGKYGFPFWSLEPGDWERVLRINVVGAVNVAHAVAPVLTEARSGTVLFVASVAGQIGSQTDPPYSASKAALINFTQCAAKDLAPFGVRVNALCPGMIETALQRSIWAAWASRQPEDRRTSFEEWAADKIRRLVPLGQWQTPQDIAAMAVFLASERARHVTGQTVNVDGGFVMR